MNLLIIDDEIMITKILVEHFIWHKLGIDEVFVAYNANRAKEIMHEKQVDIILCDIEMPQENGLQLIAWVQKMNPHIVSIILTGYAQFDYAQSAVSLGVFKFLLKPVDFGELENMIKQAVELANNNRNNAQYIKYGKIIKENPDSILELDRRIGTPTDGMQDGSTGKSSQSIAVSTVKKYIEEHFNQPVSRSDLENLVHLNHDYINREFKKATGYSLIEYIQFFRIVTSKNLLVVSENSISTIAVEVGYDSAAYFSKIFKKWTGLTPAEYRKSAQNLF